MKKILGMALYGGVMFGVTAGLGMFMMKKSTPPATTAENTDGEEDTAQGELGGNGHSDAGAHQSSGEYQTAELNETGDHSAGYSSNSGSNRQDEQLPVAVRSTPMTVEEIVRMGLSLKSRDEAIRKREESLREIESQQRLVLADLESAQQEVENLLAQTSDQRAAKEELLTRIAAQSEALMRERSSFAGDNEKLKNEQAELELARKALETEKQRLATTENDLAIRRKSLEDDRMSFDATQKQVTLDAEKLKRDREEWLKDKVSVDSEKRQILQDRSKLDVDRALFEQEKMAFLSTTGRKPAGGPGDPKSAEVSQDPKDVIKVLAEMPPESAAANLRQLDADGNTDLVVEILRTMEQRKAGAIIDALQDETLATKFLLRMSTRNTQSKSARKP